MPEGEAKNCKVERFEVAKADADFGSLCAVVTGSGRFVPEGMYTKLTVGSTMMMSDTPDEMRDHYVPLHQASGVCLVTGLGLGCVVQGMLEKRDENGEFAVEKVIVVELEEGVIELVGKPLKAKYGDRLEIRHADALTYRPPMGEKYDAVWHDIWPTICEDNLDTMATLHRKYGRRCNWQGSWQRSHLQRMRRESKREDRMYRMLGGVVEMI